MEMLFKLLAEHVYLILFISMILEFAALPLPGETMMLLAGIMAYGGHASYLGMILASALGTITGMQLSYEVGRRLGVKAIEKYGSYVGLTPYRMTKASEFFNKYGRMNSKGERYDFFTYLLLNLKNEKINCRKRVTSSGVRLKEEENFRLLDEMLGKISETEDIKIYSYFKFKLYKYLLKKEKTNNEISYGNYETEDYKIAEVFLGENIEEYQEEKEVYWNNEKSEKLRVVMVYDLENTEISKNIEKLRKISELMDIREIYRFDEFKKEYSNLGNEEEKDYFDQVLIVSNDEIQNTVINYSEKPINFLKLNDRESDGRKKSRFKKNAEFYNNLKIMDKMMKEYEKMQNKKHN